MGKVTLFLKDYVAESQDAASATEQAFANAFGGAEDALVGFVVFPSVLLHGITAAPLMGWLDRGWRAASAAND